MLEKTDPLKRAGMPLLFLTAAFMLLFNLGTPPIYILDEAKNAQAAREMLEQDEWVVPTFNAEPRLHKPPLHYYFMRVSYAMFGVNAFGARFFSAVMGWLTIWITWYFVRRFIGKRPACWTAMTLLLATHFVFEFRLAVPDPYLIFFFTAGMLCFYAYAIEKRIKWLLLSAIAMALAVLAKGPVALLLGGSAVLCWTLVGKRFAILWSWKTLGYGLLILALALPWYIAVHRATEGAFTREFLFTHNLERFGKPMEGHGGSPLLIPLFVFVGLLPMAVFLPSAFRRRAVDHRNPLVLLSACVAILTILFFSLSGTKLPNYPMPCYPFVAIIIGTGISSLLHVKTFDVRYVLWPLLVIFAGLFGAAHIALSVEQTLIGVRFLPLIFLIPVIAVALGLFLLHRMGVKFVLYVLAGGYIVFNLVAIQMAYPAIYRQNPVTKMAPFLDPDEQLYAYKLYNPAFNFYLNKPIIVLHDEVALQELLSRSPQAKVIARARELEALTGIPIKLLAKEKDLFEPPVSVIFSGMADTGGQIAR